MTRPRCILDLQFVSGYGTSHCIVQAQNSLRFQRLAEWGGWCRCCPFSGGTTNVVLLLLYKSRGVDEYIIRKQMCSAVCNITVLLYYWAIHSNTSTSKPVRTMKRLVFALQHMSASFNPFERIVHHKTVFSKKTLKKLWLTIQSLLYDNEA